MNRSIDVLWRRLEVPGHDACQFVPSHTGWTLRGASVFLEGEDVCQLRYQMSKRCCLVRLVSETTI